MLPLVVLCGWLELRAWRRGVQRGSAVALLGRGIVVLTVAWLAILLTSRGNLERWRIDWWGTLAGGAWTLTLLAESWIRRIPPTCRRLAGQLALALSLSVLLGEGTLRAWASISPRLLFMRGAIDVSQRIESNRIEPGSLYMGLPLNSRGYLDEEFGPRRAGIARVVSISDSFGSGPVLRSQHFTAVAEQALEGIEVLNLGIPCVGPVEYAHLLVEEGLPLEPDLVLVNVFVGNDVSDVWTDPWGERSLLPSFFNPENVLLIQVPKRLLNLQRERRRGGLPRQIAPSFPIQTQAEIEQAFPWVIDPLLEPPQFSQAAFLELERFRARVLLREAGIDRYRDVVRWLAWMRDRADPVPLVVMILPDEFQVEDELRAHCLASLNAQPAEVDRAQRLLRSLCAEEGLPVLDLLPAMLAVPPLADGRRHLYRLRDTHFNSRGCRVAGLELARFLADQLELPARTTQQ
jgi:hypothetical protein